MKKAHEHEPSAGGMSAAPAPSRSSPHPGTGYAMIDTPGLSSGSRPKAEGKWRLPSGLALAVFALEGGFVVPRLWGRPADAFLGVSPRAGRD